MWALHCQSIFQCDKSAIDHDEYKRQTRGQRGERGQDNRLAERKRRKSRALKFGSWGASCGLCL